MTKRKNNLPRRLPPSTRDRNYQSIAEDQFAPQALGSKSLLRCVSSRLPTPPTSRSKLLMLVNRQSQYACLLGRLMSGWSLSAASVASGIERSLSRDWLSQGLADQQNTLDSYYSRFASDVYAALAFCVGDAEATIAARNPIEYLRTGPGRAFYAREQYWQPPTPGILPEDDINPLPIVNAAEQSGAIDNERMAAAMRVLKSQGLINNEFQKQLTQQHGLTNSSVQPATDVDPFTVDNGTPVDNQAVVYDTPPLVNKGPV